MTVVALQQQEELYVILGIDENGHDQVVAVCRAFSDAKQYCTYALSTTQYLDVWIEKHLLQ